MRNVTRTSVSATHHALDQCPAMVLTSEVAQGKIQDAAELHKKSFYSVNDADLPFV